MPNEWYDNKELFEMFQSLKNEMSDLKAELAETKTLIRDYNGLREKINQTEARLNTLMWVSPIIVSIVGVLFTILNFVLNK